MASDRHLVNNVGVAYYGPTENMTAEQWDWLLQINLHAPIQFTRELIPVLMARRQAHSERVQHCGPRGGRTLDGLSSEQVRPGRLYRGFASEFVRKGVGLTALCPGAVRTNLYRSAVSGRPNKPVPEPPAWICATPEQVARKAIRGIKKNRGHGASHSVGLLLCVLQAHRAGVVRSLNCIGRRKKARSAGAFTTAALRSGCCRADDAVCGRPALRPSSGFRSSS